MRHEHGERRKALPVRCLLELELTPVILSAGTGFSVAVTER